MTNDKLKAALLSYGRQLAHLTPAQKEARLQASCRRRWLDELHRLQDPEQWELDRDKAEADTYW
jgi:hypothetical protein